jgi:hypothetical protein
MRYYTFPLFIVFSLIFTSNVIAGRIAVEQIIFDLEKVETENLGIIVWDQREMVSDRSQPESFLGYVRGMYGIAYGYITKSEKSFTGILEAKIQQSYDLNGTKVGFLNMSPYENEGDLIQKIKNSSFDKILVLRLNNFIFDGRGNVEFVVDVETLIYNDQGGILYQNNVKNKTPMGSSRKVKKTVPANIKSSIEGILNNSVLRSELAKSSFDIILTKEGEEIEGKIIEITEAAIKYKSASQPDGPIRNIVIEKVLMIKYRDGTKEVISKPK